MALKLLVGGFLLGLGFLSKSTFAEEKVIGSLYQCAHGLRGVVSVKNDREIVIRGFNYDGKGPSAWFHAMKKGAKGVYTSDGDYVTLPYPGESCDRLKKGRDYKDENVTVILPSSIKEYATIGVYCYEYCHNFGHFVIPDDLNPDPAPQDLQVVQECPKPNYKPCTMSSSKHYEIKPSCTAGAPSTMYPIFIPADGGAAALFYSGFWMAISVYYSLSHNI